MAFPPALLNLLWKGVARKVAYEKPYVVGVAGSVGKTSTKEAIALVLAQSGRPVVKTHGNLGTDVGIPATLLASLEEQPSGPDWLRVVWRALFPPRRRYAQRPYYVLEYASDKPGDIRFLTDRLAPDLAVISQVAPVHLAAFSGMAALVKEELALAGGLAKGGKLLLNADDQHQRALLDKRSQALTFSLKEIEKSVRLEKDGLRFTVGDDEYRANVYGRHQLYPVLAAIAVGRAEGVAAEQIQAGVAEYQVPPGRGRLLSGRNGCLILDDSYNASPEAVKASLRMLDELGRSWKRRRVAVLGQMNELGDYAEAGHLEAAKAAASAVDFLIAVGQYGPKMLAAAQEAGLSPAAATVFATPESLLAGLEDLIQPDDLVLVKASQNGMRLERAVKLIMADPQEAPRLLVRQDAYWQNRS